MRQQRMFIDIALHYPSLSVSQSASLSLSLKQGGGCCCYCCLSVFGSRRCRPCMYACMYVFINETVFVCVFALFTSADVQHTNILANINTYLQTPPQQKQKSSHHTGQVEVQRDGNSDRDWRPSPKDSRRGRKSPHPKHWSTGGPFRGNSPTERCSQLRIHQSSSKNISITHFFVCKNFNQVLEERPLHVLMYIVYNFILTDILVTLLL